MSFEVSGARALADIPCRYRTSRLLVRGPRRSLRDPYVAFLGSSDTYGSFVMHPFVALAESEIGLTCVNLGCANAGVDALLNDQDVLDIAGAAKLVVLQVSGAQNMSNALYRVHPRRNDRFLSASPTLRAIYPEVDFMEFHFNKHMLTTLHDLSADRFRAVRQQIQQAWLARMRLLLDRIGAQTRLLWVRHDPPETGGAQASLGGDPLMITRSMLEALSENSGGVIEVSVAAAGQSGDLDGMFFGPLQAPIAELSLGPQAHEAIADQLVSHLKPIL
ncbi:DUF6473 family protein [Sedimentitalea todarodis]|uniref:DUF6473 family protein n=1 Tax=Sedimentitalea todarodis TaxID=1631240 RepID=A0ABU3V9K6_9RHOB|nr:DUF6473 family protein [Sedimentitalea todarodis]MDU9002773.1 DUF6473 family protein [Sedimentitalea todarodis]